MSEDHLTEPENEPEAESNVSPDLMKVVDDGVTTFEELAMRGFASAEAAMILADAARAATVGLDEIVRAAFDFGEAMAKVNQIAGLDEE